MQANTGLKSCLYYDEIMEMDRSMQICLSPGRETENLFGVALFIAVCGKLSKKNLIITAYSQTQRAI